MLGIYFLYWRDGGEPPAPSDDNMNPTFQVGAKATI